MTNSPIDAMKKMMQPFTDAIARGEVKCRSFPIRHQDVMDIEDDLRALRSELADCGETVSRDKLLREIDDILDPGSGCGTHGLEVVKPPAAPIAELSEGQSPATCAEACQALGMDQAKAMGIPCTDELMDHWYSRRQAANTTVQCDCAVGSKGHERPHRNCPACSGTGMRKAAMPTDAELDLSEVVGDENRFNEHR